MWPTTTDHDDDADQFVCVQWNYSVFVDFKECVAAVARWILFSFSFGIVFIMLSQKRPISLRPPKQSKLSEDVEEKQK